MSKNSAQTVRGARVLDQRDAREFSRAAKVETHKITRSAATAKAYLVEAGFISAKTGKLTGRYAGRAKG
jgi:hypothetical protein